MKSFILISILFLSFQVHAQSECFEFNMNKYSKDLERIVIELPSVKASKEFTGTVKGFTADKNIVTSFKCSLKGNTVFCAQPLGGGDFELSPTNPVELTFSYVNLAIGGSGPFAPSLKGEIDEEFAFMNNAPADSDEEEEAGELTNTTARGKIISCPKK